MFFVQSIHSPPTEHVLLLRRGVPKRVLPARERPYRVFGRGWQTLRWKITQPLMDGQNADVAAILDTPWIGEYVDVFEVGPEERAFLWQNRRITAALGPGRYGVWRGAQGVAVEKHGTDAVLFQPEGGLRRYLPFSGVLSSVLEIRMVPQGSVGLLIVDGALAGELPPGTYALWKNARPATIAAQEKRLQSLTLTGQELMTRDQVTLRMNFDVAFEVADAVRALDAAANANAVLYNRAQLALREAVSTRTLDQLLEERDTLAGEVRASLEPFAAELGLVVRYAGLRDVILPGDIKEILNQVVQARKESEANAIRRREETATTRSLLNTAKVIEENPTLLRLKELETLQEIVGKVNTLNVYDGLGGLLKGVRLEGS